MPARRLPGGDCGLHGHGELGERIFLVWRIHTCPYAAHRGGQRPRQDLFKDGMLELTLSKIEPTPEAIDQDGVSVTLCTVPETVPCIPRGPETDHVC